MITDIEGLCACIRLSTLLITNYCMLMFYLEDWGAGPTRPSLSKPLLIGLLKISGYDTSRLL